MSDPNWRFLDDRGVVVVREWPDGRIESCSATALGYRAWVALGNTPDPFVAPLATAEQLRLQQYIADVDRQELLARVRSATPAQIKTYVQANVTDLTSAKILIMKLILLVAPDSQ